jgi:hypothetical protein
MKELAALPLRAVGVPWPLSRPAWAALGPRVDPMLQWRLGNAVLFGDDPQRVLFWARLPMVLVATLLGAVLLFWGWQMLGTGAALGAVTLFAFDPSLVAHGALVTTDVGCAAFGTLFVFLLWRYMTSRTHAGLIIAGLALGLALTAKFSALFLLPVVVVLLLLAAPGEGARRVAWAGGVLLAMLVAAAAVIEAAYFFPSDALAYVDGLRQVNADHNPAYWPFMAGRFAPRFWSYYVVTYLLKEPIPSLVLAAIGVRAITRPDVPVLDRACVLLPPALLVVGYTVFSHNLGMRYVIPALPFLHLLGGAGLARLWSAGRGWRALGMALVAWLVINAAGIFPDHLSYFNEAACLPRQARAIGLDAGSSCGALWLDDSNVDWGQGLAQLAAWLTANPAPRPLRLAYFGSVPPERWGVRAEPLDARVLEGAPPPGRYVLSAHVYARLRGALAARGGDAWLLRTEPSAIVGHAYYVYDVK